MIKFTNGFGKLSKYPIATETPITKLFLAESEGLNSNIYMKREDLIPYYFGGNKVRFYEYMIPDIIRKKTDRIIAIGSCYSNNIRVVSAISKLLNIPCKLFIYIEKGHSEKIEGNLLLAKLSGAEIEFVNKAFISALANNYLSEREREGEICYFIPNGCHLPLAAFGYSDVVKEIVDQSKRMNVDFDAIFLSVGNGTTIAGLALGKEFYNFEGQIFGIPIENSISKENIKDFIGKMKQTVFITSENSSADFQLISSDSSYGNICKDDIDIIQKLIQTDGVCLDPIYNSHPFSTMLKFIEQHEFKNVLYINTGGMPLIFLEKFRQLLLN